MRKAPKVMPRTAASLSPWSAGDQGHQHRHAGEGSPSHPHPCPSSLPCPKLTAWWLPVVLHRHLQDLLEDGGVLQRWRLE